MYHELSVSNVWSGGVMCNIQKQSFLWMWYEFVCVALLSACRVVFTISCLPSSRLWCCSVKMGVLASVCELHIYVYVYA